MHRTRFVGALLACTVFGCGGAVTADPSDGAGGGAGVSASGGSSDPGGAGGDHLPVPEPTGQVVVDGLDVPPLGLVAGGGWVLYAVPFDVTQTFQNPFRVYATRVDGGDTVLLDTQPANTGLWTFATETDLFWAVESHGIPVVHRAPVTDVRSASVVPLPVGADTWNWAGVVGTAAYWPNAGRTQLVRAALSSPDDARPIAPLPGYKPEYFWHWSGATLLTWLQRPDPGASDLSVFAIDALTLATRSVPVPADAYVAVTATQDAIAAIGCSMTDCRLQRLDASGPTELFTFAHNPLFDLASDADHVYFAEEAYMDVQAWKYPPGHVYAAKLDGTEVRVLGDTVLPKVIALSQGWVYVSDAALKSSIRRYPAN